MPSQLDNPLTGSNSRIYIMASICPLSCRPKSTATVKGLKVCTHNASALPLGAGLREINKGSDILTAVATTTISLIFVIIRLYVRVVMLRVMGPDDYFVISALVGLSYIMSTRLRAMLTWNRSASDHFILHPHTLYLM
jgi:hypothetical protein